MKQLRHQSCSNRQSHFDNQSDSDDSDYDNDLWNEDAKLNWLGQSRPVVERVVDYIKSLRTAEWQRNPCRSPATLPSTLEYELWLFPYPAIPKNEDDYHTLDKDKMAAFANAVQEKVQELCSDGKSYHDEFALVKSATSMLSRYHKSNMRVSWANWRSR